MITLSREGAMRIFTIAAVSAFAASAAFAAGPPLRWHGDGTDAFFKSGNHPITVTTGDMPLHNPITFRCRSTAGCVVIIEASDLETDTIGAWPCGVVDTQPAMPGCWIGSGSPNPTTINRIHQQAHVAPGLHTLDLLYHSDNNRGTIASWEVEYRVYQRPAD
jgi:hypothetical protein